MIFSTPMSSKSSGIRERDKMQKYINKKNIGGILLILLGLGLAFGDKIKVKYYFEQVTAYIDNYLEEPTE